jgi:hypothetical protein
MFHRLFHRVFHDLHYHTRRVPADGMQAVRVAHPAFRWTATFQRAGIARCMDVTEVNHTRPSAAALDSLKQHFYFDIPELSQRRRAERKEKKALCRKRLRRRRSNLGGGPWKALEQRHRRPERHCRKSSQFRLSRFRSLCPSFFCPRSQAPCLWDIGVCLALPYISPRFPFLFVSIVCYHFRPPKKNPRQSLSPKGIAYLSSSTPAFASTSLATPKADDSCFFALPLSPIV